MTHTIGTYAGLAAIPILLWLGLELIARHDRRRRRAEARARKRRGYIDMLPPPPSPYDHATAQPSDPDYDGEAA